MGKNGRVFYFEMSSFLLQQLNQRTIKIKITTPHMLNLSAMLNPFHFPVLWYYQVGNILSSSFVWDAIHPLGGLQQCIKLLAAKWKRNSWGCLGEIRDKWLGISCWNMITGCWGEVLSCPAALTFSNGKAFVMIPGGHSWDIISM